MSIGRGSRQGGVSASWPEDRTPRRAVRSLTAVSLVCALALCCASTTGGTRRTVSIPSPGMDRALRATVVLPSSYQSSDTTYSVIYLLHGYGSSHRAWLDVAPLRELADSHQVIFVAPSGDYASWWLDSPVKSNSQFAHHIANEVVPFIDSTYCTAAARHGRALLGSSMGGHGALTLFAENRELFAGAASIGGILDLRLFPDRWEIADILGPYEHSPDRWKRHSFVGMIDSLHDADSTIVIECGTSDFALPANRRAHELLDSAGIAHWYIERPGGHTQAYVSSRFGDVVGRLVGIMRRGR